MRPCQSVPLAGRNVSLPTTGAAVPEPAYPAPDQAASCRAGLPAVSMPNSNISNRIT